MRNIENILPYTEAGTSNPLFKVEECDFGVICKSINCESVYWYDNRGSVGKYYNFLGLNKNEAIIKEISLNEKLISLTLENCSIIRNEITDLMQIFEFGKYAVNYLSSADEHDEFGFNHYNIIFPKYDKSEISEDDLKKDFSAEFQRFFLLYGNSSSIDITDFAAENFYDGHESHILATKHINNLDKSRINYYRDEIKNGKRPPIIILTCSSRHSILNSFIVDGHHKAIAYIKEQVNPALISIEGEANYCEDTLTKLKQVSGYLYRSQIEYLISRYSYQLINKEICNDEFLKQYCYNGLIERYYPNGKLKMKCTYLNNKKNGESLTFYPDGTINKREKYDNGRFICTYEDYYFNGQLLSKGDENGITECYDIYGNKIK